MSHLPYISLAYIHFHIRSIHEPHVILYFTLTIQTDIVKTPSSTG